VLYGTDPFFEVGTAGIDNVQEDMRILKLVESGAKSREQLGRQVAYEPDLVGH